jgi:hypothetical protein
LYREFLDLRPTPAEQRVVVLRKRADQIEQAELNRFFNKKAPEERIA